MVGGIRIRARLPGPMLQLLPAPTTARFSLHISHEQELRAARDRIQEQNKQLAAQVAEIDSMFKEGPVEYFEERLFDLRQRVALWWAGPEHEEDPQRAQPLDASASDPKDHGNPKPKPPPES